MKRFSTIAALLALAVPLAGCVCRDDVGDCNPRPSSTERPLQTGRQRP